MPCLPPATISPAGSRDGPRYRRIITAPPSRGRPDTVRRIPITAAAAFLLLVLVIAGVETGLVALPGGPTTGPVAAASPSPSETELSSPPAATPSPTPEPTPTPQPTPPPPTPRPTGIDEPGVVERLQAALDAGQVALAAPGIQASVVFPDGRVWTGVSGVADLATGRALGLDTPFAIASISKTFVAAEVLLLVSEGRLSLDDAPARLLPKTRVAGRAIDPGITIRMLLDHTSGLGDYLISAKLDAAVRADPLAVWTPDQALAYARRPVAAPGQGYHYANTNYVLLGLIVEGVTGRTLAQELRARFFEPLGLASASYQGFEPPAAELPTAYRYGSIRLDARPQDVTDGTAIRPFTSIITATGAAGSLAMSAADLARWGRALYGGEILPPELLGLMLADAGITRTLDPAYPYGLGVQAFMIDGRVTYGHSGRLVGARSILRWFPVEGVGIAIVTNESRFDATPVLVEMLAIVAPHDRMLSPRHR
ncbi:MAG: class A beta-lactamase-related serine hydrolase [Chloroflexota bacterium]|nr:MAG: class A beta-lactamase-related serine hydrolase [Chloroflexota bacterium]